MKCICRFFISFFIFFSFLFFFQKPGLAIKEVTYEFTDLHDLCSFPTAESITRLEYSSLYIDDDNNYFALTSITTEGGATTDSKIAFLKSTDQGDNWSCQKISTATGNKLSTGIDVSVSKDEDNDIIVVSIHDTGSHNLKFLKSADLGQTWQESVVYYNLSVYPDITTRIAVDQNGKYLIFTYLHGLENYSLSFFSSTNQGQSWSGPFVIDSNISSFMVLDPFSMLDVFIDQSNNYFISYSDGVTSNSYKLAKYNSSTQNWSTSFVKANLFDHLATSISQNSQGTLFYYYIEDENYYPALKISTNQGQSWSDEIIVSDLSIFSQMSSSFDSGDNLFLAYGDLSNDQIVISFSTNSGLAWNTSKTIEGYDYFDFAIDQNDSYVVMYNDYDSLFFYTYVSDDLPPSISLSSSFTHTNNPIIEGLGVDNLGNIETVQYQIGSTDGAWVNCLPDDDAFDSSSENFVCNLDSSSLSDNSHTVYFRSSDTNYNTTIINFPSYSFTLDTQNPSMSNINVLDVSSTNSTITWTTNEDSSTQVEYGINTNYGITTTLKDTSTRQTNHTQLLSSLSPCTVYHYRTKSTDEAGNTSTSDDNTFATFCHQTVPVDDHTDSFISTSQGGTVAINQNTDNQFQLTIPSNYASTNANFQIKKLSESSTLDTLGKPSSNTNLVGGRVFDLSANVDNDTTIDNFNKNITLTVGYTDQQISGLSESSLKLYYYNQSESRWDSINCSIDQSANQLTCTTNHFSTFALFGDQIEESNSPNSCTKTSPPTSPWLYAVTRRSPTSVDIYYTDSDDPITHYLLEYGKSEDNLEYGVQNIGGKGSRIYTINSLQPNTNYYFQVRGVNDCAQGPVSNIMSTETLTLTSSLTSNNQRSSIDSIETEPYTQEEQKEIDKQTQQGTVATTSLTVKVLDEQNNPVSGAKLELHSDPVYATTDERGLVTFSNIPKGKHELHIAYNNKTATHTVDLTDPTVKTFTITVKLENTQNNFNYFLLSVPLFVLCLTIFLIIKNKKRNSIKILSKVFK